MAKNFDAKCKGELFSMQGETAQPPIEIAVLIDKKAKAWIPSSILFPFNNQKLSTPLTKGSRSQRTKKNLLIGKTPR